MTKFAKGWPGTKLIGDWEVTIKIDGIRAFLSSNGAFSRANKPLNNLSQYCVDPPRDVEVFCGTFKETFSKVMSKKKKYDIEPHELFDLEPIDSRLVYGIITNPEPEHILKILREVNSKGYEGLVLRQGDNWFKVKPHETYDVIARSFVEGEGKYVGTLGAIVTDMGNVSSGLKDEDRDYYWNNPNEILGQYIEVECMQLTEDGKFRHPVFIRVRSDK